METIEKLLKSELEEELEALSGTELGSDDYKVAVEGITKLMDRQIEISKLMDRLIFVIIRYTVTVLYIKLEKKVWLLFSSVIFRK